MFVTPNLIMNRIVILFLLIAESTTLENAISNSNENIFADNLLHKLRQDEWKEDEYPCLTAMTKLLEGAKNNTIWSAWVLDSMQPPVGALYGSRYHLGNFDQCLDDTWSSSRPELETQYCLVDLTAKETPAEQFHPYGDVEGFIKSRTRHGRRKYVNSVGVCVPSSCSPGSVEKISRHIINFTHLCYSDVTLDPRNCQTANQTLEYSTGFSVFWSIIVILTSILVAVYLFEDDIKDSKCSELVSLFSPQKNLKALTATNTGEVNCLHGMRSISTGTTIVMHYIYAVNILAIINHTTVGKDVETRVGRTLIHLDVLIDSFFAMSGFLLVRGLCSSQSVGFFSTLSKRYKRLITVYMMIILYMVYVSPHTGSGPLWPKYLKEQQEPCVRNWWPGLFMMANIINSRDICYVVTWYISADFQLTVMGVIAFYFWKRSRKTRLYIFSIGLTSFIILPSFLSYHYKLPHILLYNLDEAFDISQNHTAHLLYFKPYNRASSYMIGFATGYIMAIYKPEQDNKIVSKASSVICSLILLLIVGSMLYTTGSLIFEKYGGIGSAICAGLDKTIWSIGVCGLIALCEYGTIPIVTDLLTSKVFVPLSRLSYGAYLIHMAIIFRNVYSLRAPITYDIVHLVINGLGYVVLSFVFSYLQWFIIEAPAANFFNNLQRRKIHHNIEHNTQHSKEK